MKVLNGLLINRVSDAYSLYFDFLKIIDWDIWIARSLEIFLRAISVFRHI
jgi:hypothetical protein